MNLLKETAEALISLHEREEETKEVLYVLGAYWMENVFSDLSALGARLKDVKAGKNPAKTLVSLILPRSVAGFDELDKRMQQIGSESDSGNDIIVVD